MDSSAFNDKNDKNDFTIYTDDTLYEIHFNGPINSKSMSELIKQLLIMQKSIMNSCKSMKRKLSELDEAINIDVKQQNIKLFITSNGGSVHQVFGAIDTIKCMKVPVHTICKGLVASAGTLLSIHGAKRFITPNAYMLIHELRSGSWGKYQQLKDSFENCTNLMDHIKKMYIEKTKLTEEDLTACLHKDTIWNANICITKGLVDEMFS